MKWTGEELQQFASQEYVYAVSSKSSSPFSFMWIVVALIAITPILVALGLYYFVRKRSSEDEVGGEEFHHEGGDNQPYTSTTPHPYLTLLFRIPM